MINNRKVLALVPARGGSKGIKNKNIYMLCGKPLIAYTIDAAKKSLYIDDIVLTTDNEKIAKVAKRYGADVPFMRPEELATDKSKTADAVLHAIETLKNLKRYYDILVLLQPTQPLRTTEDIDSALEKFISYNEESLLSVSEVTDHPIFMRWINDEDKLVPLLNKVSTVRRQDLPIYYKVNGCIYINKIYCLDKNTSFNDNSIPFIMERGHSVDIDELFDIFTAEYYINASKKDKSEVTK